MEEQFTYRQIPTDRNVSSLTSYSGGEIIFRWQTTGGQVWHPNKSVVRARCTVDDGSGNALALLNGIAVNMDFLACTLNRVQLKCNNKVVSEIEAYVGQVDMMWKRLRRSKMWLDGVGSSCESLESSAYDRINKVSSDGKINQLTNNNVSPLTDAKLQDSLKLKSFEAMWKPGMDIFDVDTLGQGNWSLHLFPLSNTTDIQRNAVETISTNVTPGANFSFNLTSLYLDVATSYQPSFVQGPLRLKKMTAHVDALTGGTSYTQQTFTVPRNTVALTYAVQSARYGSNTRVSAAKMTLPLSAGSVQGGYAETSLTRLQLNFKGLNAFQTELDPQYVYGTTNFLNEMYNRHLLNARLYSAAFPGESFQDWVSRGACIHAPFNAGPDASGTLATVQYQYSVDPTNAGAETPRIFLFTHESVSVDFATQDSVIIDSQVVPL